MTKCRDGAGVSLAVSMLCVTWLTVALIGIKQNRVVRAAAAFYGTLTVA